MALLVSALGAQRIPTELLCAWSSPPTEQQRRVWTLGTEHQLTPTHTLLRFADAAAALRVYQHLRFHPELVTVQYNWVVQPRRQPNDPDYDRQPNLARQGFEEAWEETTGGELPNGVPIVTAILDAGFDADHEDLRDNLWTNAAEVPGDGVDNDDNGYVDDLHGFNFIDSLGEYNIDVHGTQVAGIVGAVGDNGIGVTGTNWRAQLMLFSIRTVADIIRAYEYIIDQRRQFNESRGLRGTLVVVTNASFGVEGATCSDFPVWGAMYDRLGEVGILTAASVANAPRDVDLVGDMPTDCPSEFLISVTNLGENNALDPTAGYGPENVDLAAAGTGSYSTRPGDRYGPFSGTSAAAPYVTGAISLLYAGACPGLITNVFDRPAAAARLLRQAILEGTAPEASLTQQVASGGVLDVARARAVVEQMCPAEVARELVITSVSPNPAVTGVTVLTAAATLPSGLLVSLTDALGRVVGVPDFVPVFAGTAGVQFNVGALPAGYYFITIRAGTLRAHAPVVVH